MIIWHRNRRGRGGTTPRCRSRNIANNTFSEGWLQKSNEFAGLRTAPATHHAKNTANTTFSCGMLQNAGFGTIPCGGGGVVANREPGSYIRTCIRRKSVSDTNHISSTRPKDQGCGRSSGCRCTCLGYPAAKSNGRYLALKPRVYELP